MHKEQRVRPRVDLTVAKATWDVLDAMVERKQAKNFSEAVDILANNFLLTHGSARHEHVVNLETEIRERVNALMSELREDINEIVVSEVELGMKKKVAEEEMPEVEPQRQTPSFIASTLVTERRPECEVLLDNLATTMVEYWVESKKPMSMKVESIKYRLAFRASKWSEFIGIQDNGHKAEFEKKLDVRLFEDANRRSIAPVDYSTEFLKVYKDAYGLLADQKAKLGGLSGGR